MSPTSRARLAWGLLLCLAGPTGCRSCEDDRPYTPFGIASSIPAVSASASASAQALPSAEPPKFAPRLARRAPDQSTQWQLGGLTLAAPKGRKFELGLSADFDRDSRPDAVAWTLPARKAQRTAPGELWLFPGVGTPRMLLQLPGFVPTGPDCQLKTSLAQTGPRTVTLDVSADCKSLLIARSPIRSISVIAPTAARPLLISARVAPPAPGEAIDLFVSSTDRDGDGRDDVRLSVKVHANGTKRPAVAHLSWLDRAAGPSREPHEPLASLERRASLEQIRARGKNTSRTVPDGVANLHRLVSSLCHETGTARLFDDEGAALRCGSLQRVADRLADAEVRAYLTQKNVQEASAVLARDGWYEPPTSPKQRQKLEQLVTKATTQVDPGEVVTLQAVPPAHAGQPRWSPLRFEQPEATLLVQTASGMVRVSADGSQEEPLVEEDAGAQRWPLVVSAPDGAKWTGIVHACNRSGLLLSFTPPREPQPIRLLAARPGACANRSIPPVSAEAPLGFKQGKLQALVAGSLVGPAASQAEAGLRQTPPGSPRSPDGKLLVIPTPLGLLVTGGDQPELWRSSQLGPWHTLSDCVVANGARAVACVNNGRILLARR